VRSPFPCASEPHSQPSSHSLLRRSLQTHDPSTYPHIVIVAPCFIVVVVSTSRFIKSLYPLGQPRLIVPAQFCSPFYPTHTRQSTTHLKQWHLQTGISCRHTTHSSRRMSLLLTTQMSAEDDLPPSHSGRSTTQAAVHVIPRRRSPIKRASGNNKNKLIPTNSASKTPLTCRYGLATPVRP
jgi:hypothetical protein